MADEFLETPEDVQRRKEAVAVAAASPPPFVAPPEVQPMGFERFLESRLAAGGNRSNRGRAGKGPVYNQGPYRGMSRAQAEEAARAEYTKMGDAGRARWEKDAQGQTIRSDREREAALVNSAQEKQAYGFAPTTGAAPAAGPSSSQAGFPRGAAGQASASAGTPTAFDQTRNAQASTQAQAGITPAGGGLSTGGLSTGGLSTGSLREGSSLDSLRSQDEVTQRNQTVRSGMNLPNSPRRRALATRIETAKNNATTAAARNEYFAANDVTTDATGKRSLALPGGGFGSATTGATRKKAAQDPGLQARTTGPGQVHGAPQDPFPNALAASRANESSGERGKRLGLSPLEQGDIAREVRNANGRKPTPPGETAGIKDAKARRRSAKV